MSYILKTNIANKSNYGGKRNTGNIKYLVYHYTGNDGDTVENNGKHFHNHIVFFHASFSSISFPYNRMHAPRTFCEHSIVMNEMARVNRTIPFLLLYAAAAPSINIAVR